MNDVIRGLLSHRSIRKFKDEPVPDEHVELCVRAGQMASTSSSVQSYSAIRVRDDGVRARLAELCGPQEKVARSGAFLVINADSRRHRLVCEREGQSYDQGLEAFLVAVIDAALFAEKMVIAFESLGYGICYIGGLRNRVAEVDELLGIPEGVYPLFGLCVGVPDESPSERPRLPVEGVLFEERYPEDGRLLPVLDGYDEIYRAYLTERGVADADGWSDRMARKYASPERAHLPGYYSSKGARFDA